MDREALNDLTHLFVHLAFESENIHNKTTLITLGKNKVSSSDDVMTVDSQ